MKAFKILLVSLVVLAFFGFNKSFQYDKIDGNFAHQTISKKKPFQKGEEITYLVHYGFLDAGEATLSVKNEDTSIDGSSVLHVVGEGKTLSMFEWFYKVRDVYESYIDEEAMTPRKFKRRVNEGGFTLQRDYHFVPEEQKVITEKKGELKTPENAQDMLSSFYYLRALDFSNAKKGQVFKINAFMDYEHWPVYVKYMGEENVKIKMGSYNCLKFVPMVQEGRVFRNNDDLEIWVSNDANKVPILVKANIYVGSVKAELTSHKNLEAPLTKASKWSL